jgi:enamine deaminase RidA (YjgF/YER057c/UK114 family)
MASVSPTQRLGELGLELPQPRPAGGAYSPVVIDGGLAYVSGLIAIEDDAAVYTGILGQDLDIEDGQQSARIACLRSLGTLAQAIGGLDHVQRIVKVTGYVRALPTFTDLPKVLDGASTLLIDLFGEAGRSARTTVGVAALPRGASVEVDMIVRLGDS